jgi:serine/threonine-protein kinase
MKIEDATTALDDVPLANKVTEKYDDTIPSGVVISQKPAAGGTAPKNSTVELVVSKGPPPVPVPNVVGMNLTDAARMLTAAGFQVRAFNLPGGPDRVLDQSPNGDQQAPKGSRVTLSVF